MSSWLLLKNGNIFDGRGDALRYRTSVLVHDGQIAGISGDAASLREQVPRGEEVTDLDATGKTVMPGLIDAHCHMTYGESKTQEEIDLYTGVEARTLIAASNTRRVLRAGVTSISQPGGSYNIGVALRDGIRSGLVTGPRCSPRADTSPPPTGLSTTTRPRGQPGQRDRQDCEPAA